jgi:hypothetical protein
MSSFVPCRSCARHVKQSDATCPFCGNEVSRVSISARVSVGRLSRAALFAAGAAGLALATTDCGSAQSSYGGSPCPVDECGNVEVTVPFGDASGDAADGAPSTADGAAGDAGPNDGGTDGSVVSSSDGGEAGH